MRAWRSKTLFLLALTGTQLGATPEAAPSYTFDIAPIDARSAAAMRGVSWHEGCPEPISALRQLRFRHFDAKGRSVEGILIVHASVAPEMGKIFEELYAARFPLASVKPVREFGGSDDRSMAANNTSAFNCRAITGKPGTFSRHSYGKAIDINPLWNPYVRGKKVLPPEGARYKDRSNPEAGWVRRGGAAHRAFTTRGWSWGGSWKRLQDYQHFEKK